MPPRHRRSREPPLAIGVAVKVRLGFADDERLEPARGDLVGPRVGLDLALLPGELLLALRRQRPDDRVEQVAGPAAVRCRDGIGLVPTEGMELGGLDLALLVVGLVDRDDHRRRGAAQQLGRLEIGGRHADRGIDDEHDHVGLGDGQPCLLLDTQLDRVVGIDLEPARVDQHEPAAVPFRVAVQPVPGRPGAVLDDRRARADDAVEQRALADVRPADDGDERDRATEPRAPLRRRSGTPRRSGRAGRRRAT